jgi:predicted nucleic acid-binding Zn ribbon protein
MKTLFIRTCKLCGKKIGKGKQYCDECRKIIRKETEDRRRGKPGEKEKQAKRIKEYYAKPGAREKRAEYKREYYHNCISLRLCKRCGKEIGKWKQYCDECREIRRKEVTQKHLQKPEVKEKRSVRGKEYWARPEVKARYKARRQDLLE